MELDLAQVSFTKAHVSDGGAPGDSWCLSFLSPHHDILLLSLPPHPPFILASSLPVSSAHWAGFGLGGDLQSTCSHPKTGESHPAEKGKELDAPLPGFLVQVA